MKIIQSIESIYEEQYSINSILKDKVDSIFNGIRLPKWHYFSRLKGIQSFALKLETGRIKEPLKMEDFFACTLVVENLDQISQALKMTDENFHITERRPKYDNLTHKESSSFQFDDLRLYANLKNVNYLPPEPISNIVFEIQIKTFLQHAWGIATHDLIYKTDEINWAKERIAFQIKAMLEQVEVTISGVKNLINQPEILKDTKETLQQKKILSFYSSIFEKEDLPDDIVRLCKNTNEFLKAFNLQIEELVEIVDKESKSGRGPYLKNLSPYLLIIQSVINQQPSVIQRFLNFKDEKKFKLVLPKELNLNGLTISNKINTISLI